MSDAKTAATWHPYATREDALEAEARVLRAENERLIARAKRARSITRIWAAEEEAEALRDQRDALVSELARARGCTENGIRCAHGIEVGT